MENESVILLKIDCSTLPSGPFMRQNHTTQKHSCLIIIAANIYRALHILILHLQSYPLDKGPIRSISQIGPLRHCKAKLPKFKQIVNSGARIQTQAV